MMSAGYTRSCSEIVTCNRPFCTEDSVMEVRELRFRWRGKYTFLKTGVVRELCERHGRAVLRDNAKIEARRS